MRMRKKQKTHWLVYQLSPAKRHRPRSPFRLCHSVWGQGSKMWHDRKLADVRFQRCTVLQFCALKTRQFPNNVSPEFEDIFLNLSVWHCRVTLACCLFFTSSSFQRFVTHYGNAYAMGITSSIVWISYKCRLHDENPFEGRAKIWYNKVVKLAFSLDTTAPHLPLRPCRSLADSLPSSPILCVYYV